MLGKFGRKSGSGARGHNMANMVEKMPVAVMTCDLKDFTITYVNEASR